MQTKVRPIKCLVTLIPLDSNIRKLGFIIVSCCSCCEKAEETPDHLFLYGDWAAFLWQMLRGIFEGARPLAVADFISLWIAPMSRKNTVHRFKFGMACFGLWKI